MSLQIGDGEVVAIIGPSGSGKSTLLRCINLLEKPDSGHIFVDGVDVTDPKTNIQQIRQKVGMVFQHFNLFPHMTVLRNMTYALVNVRKLPQKEAEQKCLALLERVGLVDKANVYPATLSGGQKQRAAIARTLAMDPERTPVLYEMAHSGLVFDHFYTPLWGVSTSDGEYTTTTGLIPKSGVWSYSQSAGNYMPFGFGNQFSQLGYRTMAFHDYLYTYYDRDKSFPNMGYEYYALGHGLELEEIWPPSDLEMMEEIVPMFVDEEQFMVYCLTVSGHLNYTYEENAMSRRHWDEVAGLPYSEGPKAYLACQMELELAMESLLTQLEEAGRLDDTVIVLSGDHYPYGLTDEEYSELLGRQVDPNFEIFQNTLILWNAQMEEPVRVEKLCSSLDVMPTLANLFGLEYDSRLMAGRDILSDEPGLVIFSNYSFLTEEGAYNSVLDEFRSWDGSPPDEAYVQSQIAEVQNRVAYSAMILDHDYYRVALNGPPREEGSLFSAHREPQPDSGWLD